MEDVHKPHNLSAVRAPPNAVGIFEVHAWQISRRRAPLQGVARGARGWMPVRGPTWMLESAAAALRERGLGLVAAHPEAGAGPTYRDLYYTRPIALVLGQGRRDGVSPRAVELPAPAWRSPC